MVGFLLPPRYLDGLRVRARQKAALRAAQRLQGTEVLVQLKDKAEQMQPYKDLFEHICIS